MECLKTVSSQNLSTNYIQHSKISPDSNLNSLPNLQSVLSSKSSSSPSLNIINPSNSSFINSDLHTPSPTSQQSNPSSQIPEFTHQLEQLSSKLVRSIERIASLEDELNESRRKNEHLCSQNAQLKSQAAQHKQALEGGLLVERENVQQELQKLNQRVVLESERRSKSEASLSSINQELDDLSASLFTEANRLVATEKLARIQAERKVKQVEEAMKRVEEVIEARRDQSNDLRLSLEAAERDRDHYKAECEQLKNQLEHPSNQINTHSFLDISSEPLSRESIGTPMLNSLTSSNHHHSHTSLKSGSPIPVYHSSAFGLHTIPQLRLSHETPPFTEFLQFIHHLRRLRKDALIRSSNSSSSTDSYYSAATVMTSIGINSHPSSQVALSSTKEPTPPSFSKEVFAPLLPLSQHLSQPFVKRCLDEDSDPALRLDLAPGLNFISRRPIFNALLEGNLVIEPVWSESDRSTQFDQCTLCGCSLASWLSTRDSSADNRPKADHNISNTSPARSTMRNMLRGGSWGFGGIGKAKRASNPTPPTQQSGKVNSTPSLMRAHSGPSIRNNDQTERSYVHTFRTTDASSTRYPICPTYCLTRLRAVCDFWTFVRSLERGVLLDETFWFSHYINLPPQSSRFSEVHSLGLAYDSTLKSIRQQAQSTDSLHDSPSLTHSDPSSASTSAHTFQSQNHVDLTYTVPPQSEDPLHAVKPFVSSGNVHDHQVKLHPLVQKSDFLDIGFQQTRTNHETHNPQLSPLPSPTSTSGHDVETRHEVAQPPAPSTPPPPPSAGPGTHFLVPSLSPSAVSFPTFASEVNKVKELKESPAMETRAQFLNSEKVPFDNDIELNKSGNQRPSHLHLPAQTSSFVVPATSPDVGRRYPSQSDDKAQSRIDLLGVGWEEKCWQQVVKLKEELFLKRVGIDLITH